MSWETLLAWSVPLWALVCLSLALRLRAAAIQAEELARGLSALDQNRPIWPVRSTPHRRPAECFNAIAPALRSRIAALESDRQQFRAVLESMIEGVLVVDADRRLRYANASAENLFGLGPRAVGRLIHELIRSPSIHRAVEATLAGQSAHRDEVSLVGGESVPRLNAKILAVNGTPLSGPPRAALLVFHNITELRRLERMRQDFVANVSHELKTPLASIRAYADSLLDWALEDPEITRRFVSQIDEQAERLDVLIHDLLSLARIESGQDLITFRPLALAPLVERRVESFRDRAQSRNVSLSFVTELPPQFTIPADEEALRQILDNLIDNAIKYSSDVDPWVKVVCRGDGEAGMVAIDVIDNGLGIASEEQTRIFERFYRVDKARSRERGGTGLGLAIVKHLVQALRGEIELQSRVGAGSRFTVRLPRQRPANPSDPALGASNPSSPSNTNPLAEPSLTLDR